MRDDQWFASIKWNDACLECQRETGGVCSNRSCAEYHYDEWGDKIPALLYCDDANYVDEYIENKRKQKEAEKANESN